jgi:hypothetical protein
MSKGYVYIFTNESFCGDLVKIGTSTLPMDGLIEELDTEDLPTPYDPFAIIQTEEFELLEEFSHQKLDQFTEKEWNQALGFYKLHPERALGILFDLVIEHGIGDAIVIRYTDGKPCQVFPPVDAP